MKVIINYTVYLGEDSIDDHLMYIAQRHIDIIKELGYELLEATCGVHRQASRCHIHYHTVNDMKDTKVYKILNDKIKRLKVFKEYTLVHPKFIIPEVKITFKYENQDGYDEVKSLAYPLKEYDTDADMLKDIDLDDNHNISYERLRDLRKSANDIYRASVNEKAKKDAEKADKENKKKALYSHLDSVVITTNIPHYHGEIETIVRYTVKHMLIYYKMNNQNFSIHQLKNVAINYLYFSDIIDERDICVYSHI